MVQKFMSNFKILMGPSEILMGPWENLMDPSILVIHFREKTNPDKMNSIQSFDILYIHILREELFKLYQFQMHLLL